MDVVDGIGQAGGILTMTKQFRGQCLFRGIIILNNYPIFTNYKNYNPILCYNNFNRFISMNEMKP